MPPDHAFGKWQCTGPLAELPERIEHEQPDEGPDARAEDRRAQQEQAEGVEHRRGRDERGSARRGRSRRRRFSGAVPAWIASARSATGHGRCAMSRWVQNQPANPTTTSAARATDSATGSAGAIEAPLHVGFE